MGIHDLAKYIRDNTDCYKKHHLSMYHGKKVAVDISVFLHKTIKCHDNWVVSMIILFRCLKKYGIKIVCVFDGPNAPPEKLKEREKRRDTAIKVRQKADLLENLINRTKEYAHGDIPAKLRTEIKDACMKQRDSDKFDAIDYRNYKQTMDILTKTHEKFLKQCSPVTKEHADTVKELATLLGMAVMQADGEAETMCAYMCVKGMVDAVLTEDTDVLAYETPIFLSKVDTKEESVMCLRYTDVTESFNFTPPQFKDFCIMCGCDYNDRIKLAPKKVRSTTSTAKRSGIGPKKAFNLLEEHGSIDNIAYMTDLDTTPLNYERCRILFTIPKIYDYLILPYNNPIDSKNLEIFLEKHGCKYLLNSLNDVWAPAPLIFVDDEIELEEGSAKHMSEGLPKGASEGPFRENVTPTKRCSPHKRLIGANTRTSQLDDITSQETDLFETDIDEYEIWSDGSCSGNPGPGGWAVTINWLDGKKILKGSSSNTTNNIMELTAATKGLEYVYRYGDKNAKITLYTDSEYVKNGATIWIKQWKNNGWKTKAKSEVKNKSYWVELDKFSSKLNVKYEWVKAHANNDMNNEVDKIARQESKKKLNDSYL